MNAALLEILSTRKWMITPEFAHNARKLMEANITQRTPYEGDGHVAGERLAVSALDGIDMSHISARTGRRISQWDDVNTDPYINLLYACGPITRNGDACTYGSCEHRDMIMSAADDDRCIGHVFFIDTPGGSAWAKNDYQQAIAYARSKGQPVIAFIDGMCASAGMYLASMCDARYYMHPNDEIGSIGVMAAFYTQADGSKNQFTDETYHELYDPESFDKNKWARDVANDGDAQLLVDELAELGREFRADIQAAFPKATDEHIHGKLFKASEVEGIFLDGQATLSGVLGICIDLSAKNGIKAGLQAQEFFSNKNKNKNAKIMNDNYQTVAQACGVEELVVTEEGTHLDLSLIDNLQHTLADHQTALAAMTAERDQAQSERDQARNELAEARTQNEQHAETEQTLNGTIAERDNTIAELRQQMADLQQERDNLNEQLAAAQQQVSDHEATIASLTQQPGEAPDAGESPASNGTGAEQPHMVVSVPVQEPGESRKDYMKRVQEYRRARTANIKGKASL